MGAQVRPPSSIGGLRVCQPISRRSQCQTPKDHTRQFKVTIFISHRRITSSKSLTLEHNRPNQILLKKTLNYAEALLFIANPANQRSPPKRPSLRGRSLNEAKLERPSLEEAKPREAKPRGQA